MFVTSTKKALDIQHFPKKFVAVIWRNWEIVPVENIAKVLCTTVDHVLKIARVMGLQVDRKIDRSFLKRGYLTIIRNNWHLLNYDQICMLLEITKDELFFILKEDDFMWHKMGNMKPDTGITVYEPLSDDDMAQLEDIARYLSELKCDRYQENGFAFLESYYGDFATPANRGDGSAYQVHLPDTISITYPENEWIELYAKDFSYLVEKRWGIKTVPHGESSFVIRLVKDAVMDVADHEKGGWQMALSHDTITIKGSDERHVYYALIELDRIMRTNSGPYYNTGLLKKNTVFDTRYIYSYFALYGDALLDPALDPYPEGLLRKLSESGVNGIWIPGILYQLVEYPFDPSMSKGYKERRNSLKALVKKAKRFGIDVYLYLNEPRSMNDAFYQKYPGFRGAREGDFYALCTSCDEVKAYLYNGMRELFADIPELAGFFTITMSENLTNCYSRLGGSEQTCPRCKNRQADEVVTEVNNLMTRGAKAGNPGVKAIAWTWGWNPKWSAKTIRALDEGIMLMCVNEEGIQPNVAGYRPTVIDYTMTVPGPSQRSMDNWAVARETGRKTLSKVQLNCTWELAAMPFLPLADICDQRIRNIKDQGVEGLMLSWTLGGCDSQNLDIASLYYDEPTSSRALGDYMERTYRKAGETVKKAQTAFCEAMTEFPFHLSVLYTAPQNYAPAAPFYAYKTGYSASMIGFPYDDLNTWRAIYKEEDFLNQFRKLVEKWEAGLAILENCKAEKNEKFQELLCVSKGAYYHYRSTANHISFVMERNRLLETNDSQENINTTKESILAILEDEKEVVLNLIELRLNDSRIGFEASNHYFYTLADLKEKLLNLKFLSTIYAH